jgi:hypothetical protein
VWTDLIKMKPGADVEKRLEVAAVAGLTTGEMEGNWQATGRSLAEDRGFLARLRFRSSNTTHHNAGS